MKANLVIETQLSASYFMEISKSVQQHLKQAGSLDTLKCSLNQTRPLISLYCWFFEDLHN
jgi:hypothetical protein